MERLWTQADLATKLGMSQARLSQVERGDGSFTAEQLIELLRLFNLRLEDIVGASPVEDELQNALARLGALHLREVPTALPSARVASARSAVRETLLDPRDTRLLLALAPVLVANLDALNLDLLHDELRVAGFPARVPWLVENVHAALFLAAPPKRRGPWLRASTVLGDFLQRHPPPPGDARPDILDPGIRSARTLAQVWKAASAISRKWGVASDLQPVDFAEALKAAHVAD
jgi:transcriptional regulator with XRE-family HTH domain